MATSRNDFLCHSVSVSFIYIAHSITCELSVINKRDKTEETMQVYCVLWQ